MKQSTDGATIGARLMMVLKGTFFVPDISLPRGDFDQQLHIIVNWLGTAAISQQLKHSDELTSLSLSLLIPFNEIHSASMVFKEHGQ